MSHTVRWLPPYSPGYRITTVCYISNSKLTVDKNKGNSHKYRRKPHALISLRLNFADFDPPRCPGLLLCLYSSEVKVISAPQKCECPGGKDQSTCSPVNVHYQKKQVMDLFFFFSRRYWNKTIPKSPTTAKMYNHMVHN